MGSDKGMRCADLIWVMTLLASLDIALSTTETSITTSQAKGCYYKGRYRNLTWDDGCDFRCICLNPFTGHYRCYTKCPIYKHLPDGCSLRYPDNGECCRTPMCKNMTVNIPDPLFSINRDIPNVSSTGPKTLTDKSPDVPTLKSEDNVNIHSDLKDILLKIFHRLGNTDNPVDSVVQINEFDIKILVKSPGAENDVGKQGKDYVTVDAEGLSKDLEGLILHVPQGHAMTNQVVQTIKDLVNSDGQKDAVSEIIKGNANVTDPNNLSLMLSQAAYLSSTTSTLTEEDLATTSSLKDFTNDTAIGNGLEKHLSLQTESVEKSSKEMIKSTVSKLKINKTTAVAPQTTVRPRKTTKSPLYNTKVENGASEKQVSLTTKVVLPKTRTEKQDLIEIPKTNTATLPAKEDIQQTVVNKAKENIDTVASVTKVKEVQLRKPQPSASQVNTELIQKPVQIVNSNVTRRYVKRLDKVTIEAGIERIDSTDKRNDTDVPSANDSVNNNKPEAVSVSSNGFRHGSTRRPNRQQFMGLNLKSHTSSSRAEGQSSTINKTANSTMHFDYNQVKNRKLDSLYQNYLIASFISRKDPAKKHSGIVKITVEERNSEVEKQTHPGRKNISDLRKKSVDGFEILRHLKNKYFANYLVPPSETANQMKTSQEGQRQDKKLDIVVKEIKPLVISKIVHPSDLLRRNPISGSNLSPIAKNQKNGTEDEKHKVIYTMTGAYFISKSSDPDLTGIGSLVPAGRNMRQGLTKNQRKILKDQSFDRTTSLNIRSESINYNNNNQSQKTIPIKRIQSRKTLPIERVKSQETLPIRRNIVLNTLTKLATARPDFINSLQGMIKYLKSVQDQLQIISTEPAMGRVMSEATPIVSTSTSHPVTVATTLKYNIHGKRGCSVSGHIYRQGESWTNGCRYRCFCANEITMAISCVHLCVKWNLPPVCTLVPPEAGKCCDEPRCPDGYTIRYPPGYLPE